MNIRINKALKTPIYLQIASQIKTMILSKEILDGFILPSERMMAKKLGVHRNTVIAAYTFLEKEQLICAQERVGYRVSYFAEDGETSGGPLRAKGDYKPVNWEGLIKEEYQYFEQTFDRLFSKSYLENTISFAGGVASPTIYSSQEVMDCIQNTFFDEKNGAYYSPYQGDYRLRQEIANFVKEKGIVVNPSDIQIFSETNQAADFILTLLVNPGDTVFTEEYISPDMQRALDLVGANVIRIPMDENGLLCEYLDAMIQKHKPNFIYVTANYNDPTGISMSLDRKKKLLALSYQYRIPIIEDDWTSDLALEGAPIPTMKALDQGNNVIYIHTFALTLIPGISIAFTAAPKPLIRSLRYLVSIRLLSLDWFPQRLLESLLASGIYAERIELFIRDYREKRDLMCEYLDQLEEMGVSYRIPRGGIYIWCKLPDGIDVRRLLKAAGMRGVYFMPGYVFSAEGKERESRIRLSYSNATREQIREGMEILSQLIRENA